MAGDRARAMGGEVALGQVQVRPAYPAHGHLEEDLPGTGTGRGRSTSRSGRVSIGPGVVTSHARIGGEL